MRTNTGPAHPSESVEDALTMLDSRIPLTARERRLIVESLYDLAFREGARQGRQAGIEHTETEMRHKVRQFCLAHDLDTSVWTDCLFGGAEQRAEYPDPTTAIREKLTAKAAARTKIDGRYTN